MNGSDHSGQADDPEDRDGLAAEYVLGTLEPLERAEIAARLDVDPDLAAAVARWEGLLAPLTLLAPDVAPPTHVWQGLELRLEALAAMRAAAGRRALSAIRPQPAEARGAGGWRTFALAASLAALALGGLYANTLLAPPTAGEQLVAVLQSDGKAPGFLLRVDVAKRELVIQRVGASVEAGKAQELWIIADGAPKPVSLGVVGDRAPSRAALANLAPAAVETATFAISLEPAGGSPTGLPTGPVQFTGKLIPSPEAAPPG